MRGTEKYLAFLLIAAYLAAAVSAASYYADVTFDIDSSGFVQIRGLTNHPSLAAKETDEFTSKKGKFWLLNITLDNDFSDFAYAVYLPKDAAVNYAKSPTPLRIGSENGKTFVKGYGKDSRLEVIVQYSIEPSAEERNYFVFAALGVLLLGGGAWYFARRKPKETRHHRENPGHPGHSGHSETAREIGEKKESKEAWYNKEILIPRQRDIVGVLESHQKPVTQKYLEEHMEIPKSSLSRNIDSLVKRGILNKESNGMTNLLSINPKRPEF